MGGFALTQSCGKGNNVVKDSSRRQMRDASDASFKGTRNEAALAASTRQHSNTSNKNLTMQDASTSERDIILSHQDASNRGKSQRSNEVLGLGNGTFEVSGVLTEPHGTSFLSTRICNVSLKLLHRTVKIQISLPHPRG